MIYRKHFALPPLLYNSIKNSGKVGSKTYMKKLIKILINIQNQVYFNIIEQIIKNK